MTGRSAPSVCRHYGRLHAPMQGLQDQNTHISLYSRQPHVRRFQTSYIAILHCSISDTLSTEFLLVMLYLGIKPGCQHGDLNPHTMVILI